MSSEGEYFPTAVTPVTAERTASVLPGRCLLINKKLSQRCVYMYVLLLPGATAGGRSGGHVTLLLVVRFLFPLPSLFVVYPWRERAAGGNQRTTTGQRVKQNNSNAL